MILKPRATCRPTCAKIEPPEVNVNKTELASCTTKCICGIVTAIQVEELTSRTYYMLVAGCSKWPTAQTR